MRVVRWLADENFHNHILEGARMRLPAIDILRVRDVGLSEFSDDDLLGWAAVNGRVILTHDVSTLTDDAFARVRAGLPMAGVFAVPVGKPIATVIEDIVTVTACSDAAEWRDQVRYLPLSSHPR